MDLTTTLIAKLVKDVATQVTTFISAATVTLAIILMLRVLNVIS